MNRRDMLLGAMAGAVAAAAPSAMASASIPGAVATNAEGPIPQKIAAVELIELQGHYKAEAGINRQRQVNPLDIYEDEVSPEYKDNPSGMKDVKTSAIYLRIKTESGLEGLYGPIEREPAIVVYEDLRPFLIGKDALATELLWDKMYRSNRHSRDGFFMMAISAVDNTLWDLKGRFFGVPVYRLLGGPTRKSVEVYASCLGFSLEPEAVRKRCLSLKQEGYRYQKWFIGYGPGSGAEGMQKNVALVRILRETLGDDTELMFDAYSGWDQSYALEWAHQVERYHPRWMEEIAHPEKIGSFVNLHRGTIIPIASGEHFYGRWEVQRYLVADALSVVQADPEWCGGISELLKIGTVASLYDVPVIPHGHSIHAAMHVIASQSPMVFPLGEYLINKMRHYYHFEKNPPVPVLAHLPLPTDAGFGIELDPSKIDSQKVLTWS
ncbi:mandelate racemase [Edaphobacter sp. HDX4]|uniref:enolase C-terminal domain-like protein n=1 Tax=Edaphobacter sp. HDX4 TaxID=2794064 RepID=UPI002FE51609